MMNSITDACSNIQVRKLTEVATLSEFSGSPGVQLADNTTKPYFISPAVGAQLNTNHSASKDTHKYLWTEPNQVSYHMALASK